MTSKTIVQASLIALFGALLAWSVAAFLASGREFAGMGGIIAVLAGGVILSAVLPQLYEFTIGPKGVTGKLRRIQEDIDALKFLVTGHVTGDELEHLKKLSNGDTFPFVRRDTFLDELRRLWRHGLVDKVRDEWFFGQLTDSGDLRSYVAITKRGRLFPKLLDQVQAGREAEDERTHPDAVE